MQTKARTAHPTTSLDIINALDLFHVTERLTSERSTESPPRTNYQALIKLSDAWRVAHGMRPASARIALLAVDTRSEKQAKFAEALAKMGISADPMDYRWAFAGSIEERPDKQDRSVGTLAMQITYLLGLIAGRAEVLGETPHAVIVTGVFDIYRGLLDFVQHRNGKVVLAFPKSMLDHRWNWVGLGSEECPIQFVNLEGDSLDLFGVDFPSSWPRGGTAMATNGLAGI